jgi:hypothetical protein
VVYHSIGHVTGTEMGGTMWGVTLRGAFRISEVPGERWELALEFLRAGGPMFVLDGPVPVGLQRYTGWPGADGLIHVCVYTTREPKSMTPEVATADFRWGMETLRQAIAADDRLQTMMNEHGVVYEYLYDYQTGATVIGRAAEGGTVTIL